jgi:DNA-binding LacI/PurR family transcriptional regulator
MAAIKDVAARLTLGSRRALRVIGGSELACAETGVRVKATVVALGYRSSLNGHATATRCLESLGRFAPNLYFSDVTVVLDTARREVKSVVTKD